MTEETLEEMLNRVWRDFLTAHGFKSFEELDSCLHAAPWNEFCRLRDDFYAREIAAFEKRYPEIMAELSRERAGKVRA